MPLYPGLGLYPGFGLFPEPPYTSQTIVGLEIIDGLGIGTDDTQIQGEQTQLAWYLDAIGALFQDSAVIVTDQSTDGDPAYQTGYGSVFTVNPRFDGDTAICPIDQLPYLGQYVGVTIPPDASDADARALITAERGMHRGTPSAITQAATRWLSGSQTLSLINRTRPDGSASGYWFLIVVDPSEVISAPDLIAAVNAVKPGGVLWQLVTTTGTAWDSDAREWQANATDWNAN